MNTVGSISPWTQGPFSSVAVGGAPGAEQGRAPEAPPVQGDQGAEEAREPRDRVHVSGAGGVGSASEAAWEVRGSVSKLRKGDGVGLGLKAASAFPQIVHLLVAGQREIAAALSDRTGLPVVSLGEDTDVEELAETLRGADFADGFILHGVPASASQADALDEALACEEATGRRVLSWEGAEGVSQALFDHYVNEGELWILPGQGAAAQPDLETAFEALKGLPAME